MFSLQAVNLCIPNTRSTTSIKTRPLQCVACFKLLFTFKKLSTTEIILKHSVETITLFGFPSCLCGYISQSIRVKESLNQKPLRERDELTDLF